jgi:uncharacterized protein
VAQITSIEALRERLAEPNPITAMKVRPFLDGQAKDFVARSPFLLLATVDAGGAVEVSPKGDAPGFVHVLDDVTLLVPDRAGNNLAFGHINILSNPHVGLIFLSPGTGETLRVSGRATLHDDADLCERLASQGKPAKLVMRLAVDRAYFHCAKAILRSNLWKPETWDADPLKVSFGKLFAELTKADDTAAKTIDERVHRGYTPENF